LLYPPPGHHAAAPGRACGVGAAELQAHLQDLIERGGVWAYGSLWQESRGAGTGAPCSAWATATVARRGTAGCLGGSAALLRLHALYGDRGDHEGANYALRLDRVTGAEMNFLASMYFSFPGTRVAGRQRTPGPSWTHTSEELAPARLRSGGASVGLRTVVFLPGKGSVLELGSGAAEQAVSGVLLCHGVRGRAGARGALASRAEGHQGHLLDFVRVHV